MVEGKFSNVSKDLYFYLSQALSIHRETGIGIFNISCCFCMVYMQVTQLRLPVTVEERVAVTLWKLATNVQYRTLSALFGLGHSTVGAVVVETCHTIAPIYPYPPRR